ncbi:hypothetical protein BDZ89DRAFT_198181 [Hymenopellis radicata]|nr:hypothetical protein BDZ89DRAFT_198181 [Hymenopellis radicata]
MSDDESILSPPPPPAAEYTTNSYFDVKPETRSVRVEQDEADEQLSNQTTPRPNVAHEEESQTFSAMPVPQPHEVPVTMPSYDLDQTQSVWGHSTDASSDYGKAASSNGDALAHEPAPSVRMPAEDPFADPIPPITITAEEAFSILQCQNLKFTRKLRKQRKRLLLSCLSLKSKTLFLKGLFGPSRLCRAGVPIPRPKSLIQTKHDLYSQGDSYRKRVLPRHSSPNPCQRFPCHWSVPDGLASTIVAPSARAWVA